MTSAEIDKLLSGITGEDKHSLHKELTYCTVEFSGSEDSAYEIVEKLKKLYPGVGIECEAEGGCDSCGYGELVTITFAGGSFPWEI